MDNRCDEFGSFARILDPVFGAEILYSAVILGLVKIQDALVQVFFCFTDGEGQVLQRNAKVSFARKVVVKILRKKENRFLNHGDVEHARGEVGNEDVGNGQEFLHIRVVTGVHNVWRQRNLFEFGSIIRVKAQ